MDQELPASQIGKDVQVDGRGYHKDHIVVDALKVKIDVHMAFLCGNALRYKRVSDGVNTYTYDLQSITWHQEVLSEDIDIVDDVNEEPVFDIEMACDVLGHPHEYFEIA